MTEKEQHLLHLRTEALIAVNAERDYQDEKWGIQRHDIGTWLSILGEEFGEVCQAINSIKLPDEAKPTDAQNLPDELIQLAAVALAIYEHYIEEHPILK